ncbi:MAG TPA: hypothetical protein PKL68_08520 [Actinomycetota bacterium]|nr:hypothetical protein [Actinomycetota bacterium]HUM87338.1 hypothetical protein [Actinomycetota bacterium]
MSGIWIWHGEPAPDDANPAPAEPEIPKLDKKQSIIAGAITIVILIIVFAGILPKLGNYQDAWASVQAMSWRDKATLVVAMRVPGSPAAT